MKRISCFYASQHLLSLLFLTTVLYACSPDAPTSSNEQADETQVAATTTPPKPTKLKQDAMRTDANVPITSGEPTTLKKVSLKSGEKRNGKAQLEKPKADKPVNEKPAQPAATVPAPPKTSSPTASANTTPSMNKADQVNLPTPTKEVPAISYPDHATWGQLLSQHVSSSGQVDYAALKNKEAQLNAYLESLSNNTPQSSWERNQAKAYWINAYNAFTVKLILDNYPVAKITDLHGGKPWDVKWIKLGGKMYSLNQIEHDILRPTYKDARIHFAVNCAATSCPPLHNKAFTASSLSSTLESLTRKFVNNDRYNTVLTNAAEVSKIFEWYAEDFGKLSDYLNKYASTTLSDGSPITYKDYDWSLNAK